MVEEKDKSKKETNDDTFGKQETSERSEVSEEEEPIKEEDQDDDNRLSGRYHFVSTNLKESEDQVSSDETDLKKSEIDIPDRRRVQNDVNKYELNFGMPEISGEIVEEDETKDKDIDDMDIDDMGIEEEQVETDDISVNEEKISLNSTDKELINQLIDRITNISQVINKFSIELNEMDEELSSLFSRVEVLENRDINYDLIQNKLQELSAIYDLLSSDVNPFMELEKESKSDFRDHKGSGVVKNRDSIEDPKNFIRPKNPNERYNMNAMIDWIDFLQTKTRGNIEEALDYYRELKWISKDLKNNIMTFKKGLKLDNNNGHGDTIVKEDGDIEREKGDWKLSPQDHKKSLRYIEDIKNGKNYRRSEIEEANQKGDDWKRGER